MNITISIDNNNNALREIYTSDLLEVILSEKIEETNIIARDQIIGFNEKGIWESISIKISTSAIATAIAKVLKTFITRNKVDLKIETADGKKLSFSCQGSNFEELETFLSKIIEKNDN